MSTLETGLWGSVEVYRAGPTFWEATVMVRGTQCVVHISVTGFTCVHEVAGSKLFEGRLVGSLQSRLVAALVTADRVLYSRQEVLLSMTVPDASEAPEGEKTTVRPDPWGKRPNQTAPEGHGAVETFRRGLLDGASEEFLGALLDALGDLRRDARKAWQDSVLAAADRAAPRGLSAAPMPPCDACGGIIDPDSHATDDEVCGRGDGPGFYLCGTPDCQANVDAFGRGPEQRRRVYDVGRRLNAVLEGSLLLQCPRCGAAPGEPCHLAMADCAVSVRRGMGRSVHLHVDRVPATLRG